MFIEKTDTRKSPMRFDNAAQKGPLAHLDAKDT
jgi:hypothetical protein